MSKIVLAEQSSAPDTPGAGKVAIYVDTDGSLCWRRDDGTIAKIAAAGTYSLTIPATGTAALLGTAQTFTAAQTFSGALTAPGMKPASDSTTAVQIQNAAGTAILTVDTTNSSVLITGLKLGTSNANINSFAIRTVINNDATFSLTTNLPSVDGTLIVHSSNAFGAIYTLRGTANTTTEMSDPSSTYTATKDNASTTNIYYDSGYVIQNKTGFARTYLLQYIGA
jgi:hypothetical protein